jgi:HEAT repeat protein
MSDKEWQALIFALRDTDLTQSAAAATRLHRTAAPVDVPRLMDLLKDDDFFVREAAAWPLAELAGPPVLREMLVAYQRGLDDGHDNDGFTTALIELVEANQSASKKVLEGLAEDPAMRENAMWLLEFCH